MSITFVKIASVTLSSAAANIDFTSIPATYTDLCLKFSVRSTANDVGGSIPSDVNVYLNNSTTGYSEKMLYTDNGTSVASVTTSGGLLNWTGVQNSNSNTASTFSNCELYIANYAGSENKNMASDAAKENLSAGSIQLRLVASRWSNSAAITSVKLVPDYGNFAIYSSAILYGIKSS
jgi:hypothetical protein